MSEGRNPGLRIGLLLAVCCACSFETQDTRAITTDDASGVVRSPAPILTENDVDFALYGLDIGGAAPLNDHEFAILDYRDKRVVVFDTLGRVVREFGKEGGGPGEFLFPQIFVPMIGDRIGVVDGRKLAVVVFSKAGNAIVQYPLDSLAGVSSTRITGLRQVDARTWLVSESVWIGNTRYERLSQRTDGIDVRLDSTRAALAPPTVYPCNVVDEAGQPPVFSPTLRWDAQPGFKAYATAAPYVITTHDTAHFVYSDTTPPRKADRAEALREPLGGTIRVGSTGCKLSKEAALDQRSMADVIPVVRALRVSPRREVWVQRDAAPDEPRPIDVLNSAGSRLATHRGIAMPLFFLSESTYVAMDSTPRGELALRVWRVRGQRADIQKPRPP